MEVESQADVIAFLSGGADQVLRTHASMVFLRGDRAFKLKRAVRYSYLDYGTVERRREACEAELALNFRAAPRLYLAVRPVTRAADGTLALGGAGAAVDWVVEMRRFADDALLDRMAERGALSAGLIAELTEVIVAFHAAAPSTSAYGGSTAIGGLIDDNAANLAAGDFATARIDRLQVMQRQALARFGELLDRRRAAGRVRRCHGDLHLGNICIFEGRPTLFDAIEFDPAISNIDVLYDLAFLLMDLRHRRLDDFASQVFNRYLDASGEADGLPALPLFLSLRATIRSHVSATIGRAEAAESYFALAEMLLEPVPPRLIAIGGLSGTGKSTLAAALAPRIGIAPGARVLRSDVVRKRLLGVAPTTRLGAEGYAEPVTARVFAELCRQAGEALAAGYGAIIDSVAGRPEQRAAFARVAAQAGVLFTGLWLEAPIRTMEGRIGARQRDASDATIDVLRQQRMRDFGPIDWARVDAGGDLSVVLAAARARLG